MLQLIVLLVISYTVVDGGQVLYLSTTGIPDPTCGGQSKPCGNLTWLIESVRDHNDTVILIQPGEYFLLPSQDTVFVSVSNIAMTGTGEGVVINCTEAGTGIAFMNCHNITISTLSLTGCGMEQNNTNRDFAPLYAALYFLNCTSSTLDSVNVTNSVGYAAVYYTTTGINSITHAKFHNNPPSQELNGGAVLIEFPYCLPGDIVCSNDVDPDIPISIVSNASYYISNSRFSNNYAKSNDSNILYIPYKSHHNSYGHGGGISIFFKGKSQDNSICIADCDFSNNSAEYGGGISCVFEDSFHNNKMTVQNTDFSNNIAQHGGAVQLAVYSIKTLTVVSSSLVFKNCTFLHNSAKDGHGGGLSLTVTKEKVEKSTNSLRLERCNWTSNRARLGAAVDTTIFNPVTDGSIMQVNISDCVFEENSVHGITDEVGSSVPLGMGAVYQNSVSVWYENTVVFHSNHDGSGLVAVNAHIHFMPGTYVEFFNNSARDGGAIALLGNAFIVVWEKTHLNFSGNQATNNGGAIFNIYSDNRQSTSTLNCFISYYDIYESPQNWTTSFVFKDNFVQQTANAIFSTTIKPCIWGNLTNSVIYSTNLDPLTVFCWNDGTAEWSYDGEKDLQKCSDQVSTYPADFNSTNNSLKVTPGQPISLPFTAYDDQYSNVTNQLVFIVNSSEKYGNSFKYISNNMIALNGNESGSKLLLQTDGPRVLQTTLTINFAPCPLAFQLSDQSKCVCSNNYGVRVNCRNTIFEAEIFQGFWIGTTPFSGNVNVVTECIYCSHNSTSSYVVLDNSKTSDQLCSENRVGVACSDCIESYSPSVNSRTFDCVACPETKSLNIFSFVVFRIVIPLLFIFFLYITNLSLTSGLLNGAIFFAQMIASVTTLSNLGMISYQQTYTNTQAVEHLYLGLYEIWNLDFCISCFSPFCLYKDNTILDILLTNYVTAAIPILLVLAVEAILLCSSCGPFNRILLKSNRERCSNFWMRILRNERGKRTVVSCILLSYVKIAITTSYILTRTPLWDQNGIPFSMYVLFIDGKTEYFGAVHKAYAIPVLILSTLFLVAVPCLLILARYEDPEKSKRTLDYLLREFQQDYRSSDTNDIASDTNHASHEQDTIDKLTSRSQLSCCYEVNKFCECTGCNFSTCNGTCRCNTPKEWLFCKLTCCTGRLSCVSAWSRNDCRWFAGWYFVLRLLLPLLFSVCRLLPQYTLTLIVCITAAILTLFLQPYKNKYYNYLDSGMLLLLSLLVLMNIYQLASDDGPSATVYWLQHLLVFLPALWICGVLLYKLWQLCRTVLDKCALGRTRHTSQTMEQLLLH